MASNAVLITVYNRKETTIRCLFSLYQSIELVPEHSFDIYLTDDNSTDGTSNTIKELFPNITLIKSNGNLFWCRGMNLAWESAYKVKSYDFYVWLNNDVILFKNSLALLISSAIHCNNSSIISGAFRSEFSDTPTYGGIIENKIISPNGNLQEFDLLNGNLAIIPKCIFKIIGMLDSSFHHGLADHDYGLRAQKANFKLQLTSEYIGICERHDNQLLPCYNKEFPIMKRFKFLYSPLGPNPFVNLRYFWRHYSIYCCINFFFTTNMVTAFPILLGIKSKLKGMFSISSVRLRLINVL